MRNESDANVLMYILRGLRGVKRGCKDVEEGLETVSSSQLDRALRGPLNAECGLRRYIRIHPEKGRT